jgi:hypothetical protein
MMLSALTGLAGSFHARTELGCGAAQSSSEPPSGTAAAAGAGAGAGEAGRVSKGSGAGARPPERAARQGASAVRCIRTAGGRRAAGGARAPRVFAHRA